MYSDGVKLGRALGEGTTPPICKRQIGYKNIVSFFSSAKHKYHYYFLFNKFRIASICILKYSFERLSSILCPISALRQIAIANNF